MAMNKDTDELVIGFVQGRLSEQERKEFETAMAQDASLAAEVATVAGVNAALSSEKPDEIARARGWKRLSSAIDAEQTTQKKPKYRLPVEFLRVAAVAAIAVFLWETVPPLLIDRDTPAGYAPVSQQTSGGPALQIIFAGDAPLGAISELLRDVGGEISDGPSAIGLYRVSFTDEAARDTALTVLSARNDLIVTATVE